MDGASEIIWEVVVMVADAVTRKCQNNCFEKSAVVYFF